METWYTMLFDGGSRGNPGIAGAGYVLFLNDEEIDFGSVFVGNNKTNNYAEYTGCIKGMEAAFELGAKYLLVRGDSMLVIKQCKGEYAVKSENLLPLFHEVKMFESMFTKVIYEHIPRKLNSFADKLANDAMDSHGKK